MSDKTESTTIPEILAPAGNKASFLAALAAGADAVYCGLREFSARMAAKNFTMEDLAGLTRLAHDKGARVYVTLNTLVKPDDQDRLGRMVDDLNRRVHPDALIVQDLAMIELARQTGFSGEIHLSTLANVSFPQALEAARGALGVDRVVIPRELNIDEIKAMAGACPEGLHLEAFIHGALCHAVSGRCYWSSYFGGKSGLRGRCVQPCRRVYAQGDRQAKFFSCQDLSLDVLAKVLLTVDRIRAWKIEGRKKSPHYVFYTVTAYRILRDNVGDPDKKRTALGYLSRALGRPGTHYNFLPQRPQNPVNPDIQTGSGLFLGKIQGSRKNPFLVPREALLHGDVLRMGYEDEKWHGVHKVRRAVPKRGKLHLKPARGAGDPKGVPVFLTDRREKALQEMITDLEKQLPSPASAAAAPSPFRARLSKKRSKRRPPEEIHVVRPPIKGKPDQRTGVWLSPASAQRVPGPLAARVSWWLPPVIWPDEEERFTTTLHTLIQKGARRFTLNAPWQIALFPKKKGLTLWAGPFCNIANPLAIQTLAALGFSGAIASPELPGPAMLSLPAHASIPLGVVLSGAWPLCISRNLTDQLKPAAPFTSPKGEHAWARQHDDNFWLYPNWPLDLRSKKEALVKAGYTQFIHLVENRPKKVKARKRAGLWNWDLELR